MEIEQLSLNKYISSSGFCSRREADKLIEQARVTINDQLVITNARINPGDVVAIDGEPIKAKKKPIYIAFNKPVGVTSTTDVKDKSNIIYYINYPKRIFPVGRLDKDSDGLIFLTNDGDIVNKILRASNHHEKEYIVTVDKLITPDFIKQMAGGVPVLDTMTQPCFVRQEGGRRFRIILTQGLNRQIRRMCEYLGYEVRELSRVRIMNVQLGNLPKGKWRFLTNEEIDKMNTLVADSSKVQVVAPKKIKAAKTKPEDIVEKAEPVTKGKPLATKKSAFSEAPEKKSKKKSTYAEFRNKRWR
jgi:23S rRNA pseudouridine2604 synthase